MNQEADRAVEHLKKGHIIIYPTDTVWGLGCDPYNQKAVDRIFEMKNRPKTHPLILIVDSIDMLKELVPYIHPHLENVLYYNIRPLTIIYDETVKKFAEGVNAEDGSIAIRIINQSFSKNIIDKFGGPIISTSANITQQPFPKSLQDIHPDIIQKADHLAIPYGFQEQKEEEAEPSLIARYCAEKKEMIFLRS